MIVCSGDNRIGTCKDIIQFLCGGHEDYTMTAVTVQSPQGLCKDCPISPLFDVLQIFLSKSTFSKNSFRNIIRVSNSLDPDQADVFVWPDLGPNYLQKVSSSSH